MVVNDRADDVSRAPGMALRHEIGFDASVGPCGLLSIPWEPGGTGLTTQLIGQSAVIVGPASVIDGDTIEIHGTRIRLHGIDAPESRQLCKMNGEAYRCGQRAAFALSDLLGALYPD
jgi:endonuclease YncB( thermonuclease family)